MTDRSQAPLIYIDANPFIYSVEGDSIDMRLVEANDSGIAVLLKELS